jgi:hypothetical protein
VVARHACKREDLVALGDQLVDLDRSVVERRS